MNKILVFMFLFIPILSFGQLSQEDKQNISDYRMALCDCINEEFHEIDLKVLKVLKVTKQKGEEEAIKLIKEMSAGMDQSEKDLLAASFARFEDPNYIKGFDVCDEKVDSRQYINAKLSISKGEPLDYFIQELKSESRCKLLHAFYQTSQIFKE